MSAKFYDVYIRAAGSRFLADTTLLTSNLLSGWDKIAIAPEKSVVRADPIVTPVGDGTSICDGYNLVVETGEKRVATFWYNYLRTYFHNKLCDFLFVDHEQETFAIAAFGLKCQVYQNTVSGESMTIAINAAAVKAVEIALSSGMVYTSMLSPSCLVEIETWDSSQSLPVPGAPVSLALSSPSRTYTATSDSYGIARFLVETPASPTTATATATVSLGGYTWQTGRNVTVSRYGKYALRVEGTPT